VPERLYTTSEVARLLGISRQRVQQYRVRGRLKGQATPLGHLFPESAVREFQLTRRPARGTKRSTT
jgi:predicted site-specific integrase-resolvase